VPFCDLVVLGLFSLGYCLLRFAFGGFSFGVLVCVVWVSAVRWCFCFFVGFVGCVWICMV